MTNNEYLIRVLNKYKSRDLNQYKYEVQDLKNNLRAWAGSCYIETIESGSIAKGTAVSLGSDVDYLVSLKNSCNEKSGGLESINNSLHTFLLDNYDEVRKQNVSFRVKLGDLRVDITPARKHLGNTNAHSIRVTKEDTWTKTNIQRHISDVSSSGRTNEIKLLKIWRELNNIDFPSIYIEYLLIDQVLYNKGRALFKLEENFTHVLRSLASENMGNPLLSAEIVDPANPSNTLSELLSVSEKKLIISAAKKSLSQGNWEMIVY